MERQDSIYDMNIDRESSFEDNSRPQPQQKSQQTSLKIQIHPGFLCLFPSYLQKYNLAFGECYQSVVKSNCQLIKIRDNLEKIIKSDTGTYAKLDQILEKHLQQKDVYISYSIQDNMYKKQEVNFNFKNKQRLESIKETIGRYKKMNEQLIREKKNQFQRRRQQHRKRLEQQMRQKQEWENRINQQQRQAMIYRKKLKQEQQARLKQQKLAQQMQEAKQKAKRQQEARIKFQNQIKNQQQQRMKIAQQRQKQKIINLIRQNKIRQRYQYESQNNSVSDQPSENYQKEWQAKNKEKEFKRSQQRQIKCEIM